MIAMSVRRGIDEEETREAGIADPEEAALPNVLELRLIPVNAFAAVEGTNTEAHC